MTIVRVGSNKKFADGWDAAFAGKKATKNATAKKQSKKAAPAKKKTAKK